MSDKATRLTLRIDLANGVRLGPGKVGLLSGIAAPASEPAALPSPVSPAAKIAAAPAD